MTACKCLLGVLLISGTILSAEEVQVPKYEVGLNYSWLHVNAANYDFQRTGNGGSGYFAYNLNKTLGLVADFGGYANTRKDNRLMTYMFGPRFNWRHEKWNPYVQFLFGGGYGWAGESANNRTQNKFTTAAGGGLDYNLTRHISLKPIQVEYVATQFDSEQIGGNLKTFGSHQNNIRYSAGVVFKFGER